MNSLNRFLTISTTDPDDIRRRRILNILVVSIAALSFLAIVTSLVSVYFKVIAWENVDLIVIGSLITILGMLLVYSINTRFSGQSRQLFSWSF